MFTQRFLSTAPIEGTPIEILEKVAPVEICPATDETTLLGLLDRPIGIVARGVEAQISARIIDASPHLRVIGRPGAGYDTVDVAAATRRKIPVYAPVSGFAASEGALALLLAMVKRIPFSIRR
jgi:phosphoglycerate dehydrogenase-like enzyme